MTKMKNYLDERQSKAERLDEEVREVTDQIVTALRNGVSPSILPGSRTAEVITEALLAYAR